METPIQEGGALTPCDGLTSSELSMLIESLEYTRQRFEDYAAYPSLEFKRHSVLEADSLLAKLRAMRGGMRNS